MQTYIAGLAEALPALEAAEQNRETLSVDYWHNENEAADVVSDIDAMIGATRALPLLDRIDIRIYTVEEVMLPAIVDGQVELDGLPCVYAWRGSREEWRAIAHPELLASFPDFGSGLLVCVNILARAHPPAVLVAAA